MLHLFTFLNHIYDDDDNDVLETKFTFDKFFLAKSKPRKLIENINFLQGKIVHEKRRRIEINKIKLIHHFFVSY